MRNFMKQWIGTIRLPFAMMAAASLATALVACNDNTLGLCYHEYREPLLKIVAARDAYDHHSIPVVFVRNVRLNGTVWDMRSLVSEPAYGVELQGDSIVCEVPCGFSTTEGNYIFTVSTPGYPAQDRGYEGGYSVFHGGCPSYNDGGVEITLEMYPVPGALSD